MYSGEKWCRSCARWHPVALFGLDHSQRDGLAASCLESRARALRKQRSGWSEAERETAREYNRRWRRTQGERKLCPVCADLVLLKGFRDDRRRRDGKDRYCRSCRRNRAAECRDDDLRRCPGCETEFPLTEFGNKTENPRGDQTYCRSCLTNRQRERNALRRAGSYGAMLEAQEFACWICGKIPDPGKKGLCLDHDHETGEVRAFLCHNCNFVIGNSFEDPAILRRAIDYLEEKCGR
jgi:hypothetical protein